MADADKLHDAPYALIVEDDYDARVIFEQALQSAGYRTEVIEFGDKALERLAMVTPDIVVLDLHLPRVAGTDILRQIKADPRLEETKVIVVTGDSHLADDPELQMRAFQIMVKPITYARLRDLARLLKLSTGGTA